MRVVTPPPALDLQKVQEVSRLILAAASRLHDNYAAHATALGLSAPQSKVLTALDPDETVPMRALADRIQYDPSNLTGVVDKLEALALVQRLPDRSDRRVKVLRLTERGAELRQAFYRRLTSDAGPLTQLTDSQLDDLRQALSVILAAD